MTDETRILRTVGVPLIVAVVLLLAVPKMCGRAIEVAKKHHDVAAQQPAAGGLRIQSSAGSAAARPVVYPAGLDADRARYLIEVDSQFSAPYAASVAKSPHLLESRGAAALQKLGYAQAGADGTLTLTPDGMLHIDGLSDQGSTWTFPVARRQFDRVTAIDTTSDGARLRFQWHWEPNAIGKEMMENAPQPHESSAELRSGGGWTLAGVSDLYGGLD